MSVTVTLVSDGLLSLAEHKAVMSDKIITNNIMVTTTRDRFIKAL